MSKRVRRRAILSCKASAPGTRDFWRNQIRDGKTNLTPEYMLRYRNSFQEMYNHLYKKYQGAIESLRAMGATIDLSGTKTGRFKSNEPNISGTPKTIGGKDNE